MRMLIASAAASVREARLGLERVNSTINEIDTTYPIPSSLSKQATQQPPLALRLPPH